MKEWGVRNVDIHVVKWGSTERSLEILTPRVKKAPHIAQMIQEIKQGSEVAITQGSEG